MIYEKNQLDSQHPLTGQPYGWTVVLDDGRRIPWRGLYTGPLTLTADQIEVTCSTLLGFGLDEMHRRVDGVLRPATGDKAGWPALILHSTTPELKAFEGDLNALARGAEPGDLTTYKETRSVYLARPADVAVGRTLTWSAAAEVLGVEAVELPDRDHYYLSHALLNQAMAHRDRPSAVVERLLGYLRRGPRLIRLYALEPEMQIFLLWLARAAGLDELPVEANRPAVSAAWNRKAVLHPTVSEALALETMSLDPAQLLARESRRSLLAREMAIEVPTVPGYTIERAGRDEGDFVRQILAAARLLRGRYGLTTGCLKASEAGDGARITTGLDLDGRSILERLGRESFVHGDDYVLEAHVVYRRPSVAGQQLPTALSAHIRGGKVAEGTTIQFVEGTSWKGNVLLDARTAALFDVPAAHYDHLLRFITDFSESFRRRAPGMVLAGVDFAVGTVGGAFGDELLLGVQDLNVSFTGAECLRAFLARAQDRSDADSTLSHYGVTRIYRPLPGCDLAAFRQVTDGARGGGVYADTVASIPGRWAMVGITGADPADAMANLGQLEASLLEHGLIAEP